MIDRIEELLESLAAEDEEEREDVFALPVTEKAVPASPHGDGEEAGDGGTQDDRSGGRTAEEILPERPGLMAGEVKDGGMGDKSGGRTAEEILPERPGLMAGEVKDSGMGDRGGGRTVEEILPERLGLMAEKVKDGGTEARSGGRTAEEILPERPGLMAEKVKDGGTEARSGERTVEEILPERPGLTARETAEERAQTARELWMAEPVWTVQSVKPETVETRRTGAAERTAQAERVSPQAWDGEPFWSGWERTAWDGSLGTALESAGRPGLAQSGLEQAGLKRLYRQAVRGLRPVPPALPREQTGRTARMREPGSAASLVVDELDRAVRRDSRRYDGGMSIY